MDRDRLLAAGGSPDSRRLTQHLASPPVGPFAGESPDPLVWASGPWPVIINRRTEPLNSVTRRTLAHLDIVSSLIGAMCCIAQLIVHSRERSICLERMITFRRDSASLNDWKILARK